MENRIKTIGVIFILAFAFSSLALYGQTTFGSILGTVTDASGGIIPGATVTLTNIGTSERRTATTNETGGFRFVSLVPGQYRIDIELAGFKRHSRGPIALEVQNTLRIDAELQIGSPTEVVEVTSQTPLLQTENTSLSQVVEGRTIQEMPLNGRNVLNLVALVPGVVPQNQSMGNPTGINIFAWGNYQIGGGTANQGASYLDGGPLNVNYANLTALVPTQDAISEFRVQTNNLSPEFGRFSGGVINLSTKGGTNAFHGGAYEYIRNKVLNSNNFFNNKNGVPRPSFTQNQYGANVSGPIIKDKTFFFVGWEGFRLRQGLPFSMTVPTLAMRSGDFSEVRDAKGNLIKVYDPMTTCGRLGNPACAVDASGREIITRQQFTGNKIPSNRMNATSLKMLELLLPQPNTAGAQYTSTNNYVTNASIGGNNDQYNFRVDQNISDKQRLFVRYTRWGANTLPKDPYRNKTYQANEGPEFFTTHQIVIADTYTFTPKSIGDLRIAVLRFPYGREVETLGYDLTNAGLPPSMNASIPYRTMPSINVQGMNNTGQVYIFDRNTSWSVSPSFTKIAGRHTFKVGGEMRWLYFNFTQVNNPSGIYNFNNLLTSANPQSPTVGGVSTGFGMASFLLGFGSDGSLTVPSLTAGGMFYQGYYLNDTWQATQKLTLNIGVRYELPGPWTERFDRLTVFLPDKANPLVPSTRGMVGLVNTPEQPTRNQTKAKYNLFAPRFGAAYRLADKMVLRGGYGIFYIPADAVWLSSPYQSPVNSIVNTWAATLDGGLTPNAPLNNPFPSGLSQPPGRDPKYQQLLLGQNLTNGLVLPDPAYGYLQQWNLNVERQLKEGLMLELGYAGARGVHLPGHAMNLNQLPDAYLSLGSQLQQQVTNPFYGIVTSGTLAAKTVARGQLLRPHPEYLDVHDRGSFNRNSNYNSMQLKVEKRFREGGVILGSYSFSKNLGDTETGTTWLEGGTSGGTGVIQNYNNLKLEKSLASFDVTHRFVLSSVLDLPMGRGKKLFSGVSGVTDKLVSGWGVNFIGTFQSGFPLHFTTSTNLTNSFGGGSRPNVVPGCNAEISGSAQSRINKWFDTSCYTAPAAFTFGNAPRNEPKLRAAGINNWDVALFKVTPVTEQVRIQFRAEFFNIFNRVQMGYPGQALGVAQFGVVSVQQNNPRLVQFALRLSF